MGTIVAIPLSVVVDWIVQHFLPTWQAFVGIALILTGFTGFVISEFLQIRREGRHKKEQTKLRKVDASSNRSSEDELLIPKQNTQESIKSRKQKLFTFLV